VLDEVAHGEHELRRRVLQVGHAVGRRVTRDWPACINKEGARALGMLPKGPVLLPSFELACAELLVHVAGHLDAGADVVVE